MGSVRSMLRYQRKTVEFWVDYLFQVTMKMKKRRKEKKVKVLKST